MADLSALETSRVLGEVESAGNTDAQMTSAPSAEDGSKTGGASRWDADATNAMLESVLERIDGWMATEVRNRVKMPTATELDGLADWLPRQLVEVLGKVGASVSYLQATIGRLEAYAHTLRDVYVFQLRHARSQIDMEELGARPTDKAVEAAALAHAPDLDELKRKQMAVQGCLDEVKALADAWKTIWDTVSRTVTVAQIEAGIAGSART